LRRKGGTRFLRRVDQRIEGGKRGGASHPEKKRKGTRRIKRRYERESLAYIDEGGEKTPRGGGKKQVGIARKQMGKERRDIPFLDGKRKKVCVGEKQSLLEGKKGGKEIVPIGGKERKGEKG